MTRTCTAVLLLFAGVLAAEAGDPALSALIPWSTSDTYVPVVVSLTAPAPMRVDLVIERGQQQARTSVELAANELHRLTVLLPPSGDYSANATLHWSTDQGRSGELYVNCSMAARGQPAVLIANESEISGDPFEPAAKAVGWSGGYSSSTGPLRLGVEDLPDRWQAYPDWLLLGLSAEAQAHLSDGQRNALVTWLRAGGTLAVTSAAQARPWQLLGLRPLILSGDADGDETIITEGLRRCQQSNQPDTATIPGSERVPAGGFATIAVLFAIIAGPGALWWVRRRDARHLLLMIAPVLSLGTCVLLLAADLVLQGVTLKRVVRQLIVLDQTQAHAVAWTRASYQGPFAISSVTLDDEAEVLRGDTVNDQYSYGNRRNSQAVLSLDWRSGQAVSGTLVPGRSPTPVRYRQARSERARVLIERDGAQRRLINGLPVAIAWANVRDSDGTSWSCTVVEAGATATLTAGEATEEPQLSAFGPGATRAVTAIPGPRIVAQLAAPLWPLPGPEATDVEPATTLLVVHLGVTP